MMKMYHRGIEDTEVSSLPALRSAIAYAPWPWYLLYTSDTFERLQDNATGLYYQSPGYVYSFLDNELKKARVA